jgi:hypothetical protein
MILSLFSGQLRASYKSDFPVTRFLTYIPANQEVLEDFEICEEEEPIDAPIIQANECEWKENLTDLLRHRHSSYRFMLFESAPSSFINFTPNLKGLSNAHKPFSVYRSRTILPDYYSFLHRLCPF